MEYLIGFHDRQGPYLKDIITATLSSAGTIILVCIIQGNLVHQRREETGGTDGKRSLSCSPALISTSSYDGLWKPVV